MVRIEKQLELTLSETVSRFIGVKNKYFEEEDDKIKVLVGGLLQEIWTVILPYSSEEGKKEILEALKDADFVRMTVHVRTDL
jgi:hypothetical protein